MPVALVGESPLPSYNEDVWRVVWDENVETLIFICSKEELSDPSLTSWHPKGASAPYPQSGIIIESKLGTQAQDFNQYTIILTRNNQKVSKCLTKLKKHDYRLTTRGGFFVVNPNLTKNVYPVDLGFFLRFCLRDFWKKRNSESPGFGNWDPKKIPS